MADTNLIENEEKDEATNQASAGGMEGLPADDGRVMSQSEIDALIARMLQQ